METRNFNPPYLAFKTVTNFIEKLAESGIPNRIDRTYLSYLAGITQTYLLAALRTFDLIDTDDRPTERLIALVNEPMERPRLIGDLVREYYREALALGNGATPGELEQVFRESYDVRGDTNRKAITFFLNAASYGNVELSKHYKMPRASSGEGSTGGSTQPRRRRARTTKTQKDTNNGTAQTQTLSVDALRGRYIDMLMKRAENQDELDDSLLDRIESLLGYDERVSEDEPED
jgi:Family of unknown function (DUF5343)